MSTTLTPEVTAVLRRSTINGNALTLPNEQLARPLYEAVNKVLTNAGGKWNRGAKAHVFPTDPSEKLGLALETGKSTNEKQEFQAFFTPGDLAVRIIDLADIRDCMVLEPSAGHGALADACIVAGATAVDCIELNPEFVKVLREKEYNVQQGDFLTIEPRRKYARIVMNPPFTKNQDIKHVEQALKWLAPGGILVSVMMPSVQRGGFQRLIQDLDHDIEAVPAGAFKDSGTGIATILLTIRG